MVERIDAAVRDWYERERRHVEREIDLIRVYQFKMPDGIGPLRGGPWPKTWWEEFWRKMEFHNEERPVFLRLWRERNAPGGRQQTLDEAFAMSDELNPYVRAGQQRLDSFVDG